MADNNIDINIGVNPSTAESGSRRAKAAVNSVSKEARELDAAYRRLKSTIDPTFAAQEKLNKALADNKKLYQSGLISLAEYRAGNKAARQELEASTAAIQRNSAVARAAAAEAARARREEVAAMRAAAQQVALEARLKAAAERQSARDAAAAAKQKEREEKEAIRSAANLAKQQAREKAAAERQAAREAAQEAKQAAEEAKRSAREKSIEERKAAREIAEADKRARAEQREASRQAARVAAQAAKDKAAAERAASAAARAAADETRRQAQAERLAAQAANELRASIDPLFAAQQRYNQTMATATQLLMQNKLRQGEWLAIQKQAKAQMDVNVRSMGRMNSMYVQLGYQAQDVTASIASGINPMVILAQQGGQTAAALSTMGGTVGRVASFFAGPWGAAILGFTALLGYLAMASKEAEKRTLELENAEDRRIMTVKELTAALKEFNKEQREANTNSEEAAQIANRTAREGVSEVIKRAKELKTEISQAEKTLDILYRNPTPGIEGAILTLTLRIKGLKKELEELRKGGRDALDSVTERKIDEAMRRAEEATNGATAAQRQFEREVTKVNQAFRTSKKTNEDLKRLQDGLIEAIRRKEAAERKWNEAQREGRRIAEETAQYIMPVAGRISSGFGARTAPTRGASTQHAGIDIAAPAGSSVRAPQVGTVEAVGYSPTLGKYVVLSHGAGVTTRFGHLSDNSMVSSGQTVQQGQQIGKVGSTGTATGAHLHYEVRINGKAVDPTKGVFPIDQLEAEADAFETLDKARKEALDNYVESINFQQALAAEDLQVVLDLQDKKIQAIEEYHGRESQEAQRAQRERVQIERRLQQQVLEEKRRGIDQALRLAQNALQTEAQLKEIDKGQQEDNLGFNADFGLISEEQALQQRAAMLDEQYTQQVNHEQRMYQLYIQSLRDKLALENLPKEQRDAINREIEAAEAEHLGRMQVLHRQYNRDVNSINLQAASISMQRWQQVTQTFTQSLGSAFQGLWTRTITWQQAFIQMADQLVFKFADMGLKMLQDWILKQVGMTAATQAQQTAQSAAVTAGEASRTTAASLGATAQTAAKMGAATTEQGIIAATTSAKIASEGIKTGAAVTGAATQTGAAAAAGTTEITTNAAVAAAGAYKSTVVIPFIGPIAAPAAAALALAAVLGFASLISAKGGMGEVPGDQLAMVHKKEMILPAWIAEPMRNTFLRRGSSGIVGGASSAGSSIRESMISNSRGGDIHLNYSPKNTNMDASFDTLLKRDAQSLRRWIRNEVRNGRLQVSS